MAIAMQRFCINRKIAPALSIEAFFRLVNRLGLNKVELRNDLPSGKVTDDLSHQQVRELAARNPGRPTRPGAAVRLLWHPRPGGAAGLPAKLAAFCAPGADADPRRPRAV